jgi:hypothetical protein
VTASGTAEFVRQVRDALARLGVPVALQRHPFTRVPGSPHGAPAPPPPTPPRRRPRDAGRALRPRRRPAGAPAAVASLRLHAPAPGVEAAHEAVAALEGESDV